jgi:5-methylcytosine-specific restriction endonuclease McrA
MPSGRKPTWRDETLRAVVRESRSIAEVLRKLGLRPVGGNYGTIGRAIARLGLDTAHFRGKGWRSGATTPVVPARPLAAILVRNSPQIHRGDLKRRLVRAGLLAYACVGCGVSEWRGSPLALELDHVNGDDTDDRLENLRLLCPNCHSQTDTYRGRNIGKKPWRVRERPGWRNR